MSWLVYVARLWGSGVVGLSGLCLAGLGLFSSPINVASTVVGLVLLSGGALAWPRAKDRWRKDPPTERQLAYAESLGISIPALASKGEVSDLISEVTGK